MNQRYWTAGLELAMANYQLQFATYGEEVGTATANLESRRYVAKVCVSILKNADQERAFFLILFFWIKSIFIN